MFKQSYKIFIYFFKDLKQNYIEMQHREKAARDEAKLYQRQLHEVIQLDGLNQNHDMYLYMYSEGAFKCLNISKGQSGFKKLLLQSLVIHSTLWL